MAKKRVVTKKRTTRTPQLKTKTKVLHPREGKPFASIISQRVRRQKLSAKNKEKLFDELIAPEFETYFKRNRKNGNLFLFKTRFAMNFRCKKVKGGFSLRRRKIRSLKSFKNFMKDYKKEFLKKLDTYLSRKGNKTISMTGVKMEVVKREKRSKKKSLSSQRKRKPKKK